MIFQLFVLAVAAIVVFGSVVFVAYRALSWLLD